MSLGISFVALIASGMVAQSSASPLTYTLNDATHGVSAKATFNAAPGGFYIEVTNTESNTPDAGHAISQIQFTVGGGFALPTPASAFYKISGMATDFSSAPVMVSDLATNGQVDHWGYTPAPPSGDVFDVSGPVGGQPNYLIVAAGSTPNSSLTNTHLPSFVGPVDFYFTDASGAPTTLAQISGFKFAFGTTPEVPLESGTGTPSTGDTPPPAPEPSTALLLGFGMFGLARIKSRRSLQA